MGSLAAQVCHGLSRMWLSNDVCRNLPLLELTSCHDSSLLTSEPEGGQVTDGDHPHDELWNSHTF